MLGLGQPLLLRGLRFLICTVTKGTLKTPSSVWVTFFASACNTWTSWGRDCLCNIQASEVGARDSPGPRGRRPSSESFEYPRFAASGCPVLPRIRAGPPPGRPFICALAAGMPRVASPSSAPPAAGTGLGGGGRGQWRVEGAPRVAQLGAGCSGKFKAPCACENVGVGRITWQWELRTQGGTSLLEGVDLRLPGEIAWRGHHRGGSRSRKEEQSRRRVISGTSGNRSRSGEGGHICGFVGAGDSWPGEPWCPKEDRQRARCFYQRSNLERL